MFVRLNASAQCDSQLESNAEESDTRIWLHVMNSAGQNKLVLSPDTDVYHIGLPFIAGTNLSVQVRLSSFSSLEVRLLDVQALISAFTDDPDLSFIPRLQCPSLIQAMYVCTGCDFISFFSGIGKTTFLATLFEYCEFICSSTEQTPGTLTDTNATSNGHLAFYRLVGCAYFRKYKSVFLPSYPTPMSVFNSLVKIDQTPLAHHKAWLDFLRERIWIRIKYEEEMIPSDEALSRHWRRSCWVTMVWGQATHNTITYPPLNGNGWRQPDPVTLLIDWDSEDNICEVRKRVALIRKGCACKTGCRTGRCKCKINGSQCGPGCKCLNCQNVPVTNSEKASGVEQVEESDLDDDSATDDDALDDEVDEIMEQVFGSYSNGDGSEDLPTDDGTDISDDEMDIDHTT